MASRGGLPKPKPWYRISPRFHGEECPASINCCSHQRNSHNGASSNNRLLHDKDFANAQSKAVQNTRQPAASAAKYTRQPEEQHNATTCTTHDPAQLRLHSSMHKSQQQDQMLGCVRKTQSANHKREQCWLVLPPKQGPPNCMCKIATATTVQPCFGSSCLPQSDGKRVGKFIGKESAVFHGG